MNLELFISFAFLTQINGYFEFFLYILTLKQKPILRRSKQTANLVKNNSIFNHLMSRSQITRYLTSPIGNFSDGRGIPKEFQIPNGILRGHTLITLVHSTWFAKC